MRALKIIGIMSFHLQYLIYLPYSTAKVSLDIEMTNISDFKEKKRQMTLYGFHDCFLK